MLDDPRGASGQAAASNGSADGPADWRPGTAWNGKLIVFFKGNSSAQYNQGVQQVTEVLNDTALSRGFANVISTELWNYQHANPHLQGETLMMLKEYFIKRYGMPKWTAGVGGSGGAIQQYLIAQLYPGLLDGIQPSLSFTDSQRTEVTDCRLLNNVYKKDASRWTSEKQNAINGFNTGTCAVWDRYFVDSIVADSAAGCGLKDAHKVYNPITNPAGVRCDLFSTNINLLGRDSVTGFARRNVDNVGVQYGLGALNRAEITILDFLDLNEQIGGYNNDGHPQKKRTEADPEALRLSYEGGLVNSFSGKGLANIPIITRRNNAEARGDIHDLLRDMEVRARLEKANGRADNQIIWTSSSKNGIDINSLSIDTLNTWLDNMAKDNGPASIDKVVRNKPQGAEDACWDLKGTKISEKASLDPKTQCNIVYPKFTQPRYEAGGPVANDILKCQLKPINFSEYKVTFSAAEKARLAAIFPQGVCDWSKPSVGFKPLRGTYLKLPLDS